MSADHFHCWDDFVPLEYGTVTRFCLTCGDQETYKLALSEIAQTDQERNRIRGQARYRKGHALTPRGQQALTYKQGSSQNEGRAPGRRNRTV